MTNPTQQSQARQGHINKLNIKARQGHTNQIRVLKVKTRINNKMTKGRHPQLKIGLCPHSSRISKRVYEGLPEVAQPELEVLGPQRTSS